jgi:hypothetical protein
MFTTIVCNVKRAESLTSRDASSELERDYYVDIDSSVHN